MLPLISKSVLEPTGINDLVQRFQWMDNLNSYTCMLQDGKY